jgi:predicted oxidoreductase
MTGAEAVVVGAGLSGLVARHRADRRQQAGARRRAGVACQPRRPGVLVTRGLIFVDSPEQRRMGIKDSVELVWRDWLWTARV